VTISRPGFGPLKPGCDRSGIREEKEARGPTLYPASCFSVMLMGRETGLLQLLAPNLVTEGKKADLVIRGNIVLNT
jgi:hypothetical protein